jgi:putative ABC transport system substrate-binding protein
VLDAMAAETVGLAPELIVTSGTQETLALKNATSSIPIVFAGLGDPLGAGVVASLEHPGGNLTGMSNSPPQLQAQRLSLLQAAVPGATCVGVLRNGYSSGRAGALLGTRDAATAG